jgi:hypothetical protein
MPAAQGPNPEPDRIPPDQWAQMPLVDAANKVHKHVEGNHLTGMGGTEFQMKPLTLILWWKGEIPPELAALLSQIRCTVPVEVRRAKWSLVELDQEQRLVMKASPAVVGGSIAWTAARNDFTGITVAIDRKSVGSHTLSEFQTRMDRLGNPAIKKFVELGDPFVAL